MMTYFHKALRLKYFTVKFTSKWNYLKTSLAMNCTEFT